MLCGAVCATKGVGVTVCVVCVRWSVCNGEGCVRAPHPSRLGVEGRRVGKEGGRWKHTPGREGGEEDQRDRSRGSVGCGE